MNRTIRSLATAAVMSAVAITAGCGSDASTSDGGGSSADASFCVTRSLRTVYTNDCEFDVNVIIFEVGAQPFEINANSAKSQPESGNSFGACRAPSVPILNASSSGFSCS